MRRARRHRRVATPFDPEWDEHVTLEISNIMPQPAKISGTEDCAQVVFFGKIETYETSLRRSRW